MPTTYLTRLIHQKLKDSFSKFICYFADNSVKVVVLARYKNVLSRILRKRVYFEEDVEQVRETMFRCLKCSLFAPQSIFSNRSESETILRSQNFLKVFKKFLKNRDLTIGFSRYDNGREKNIRTYKMLNKSENTGLLQSQVQMGKLFRATIYKILFESWND